MATLPWFFSFDHIPTPGTGAVGDGAMSYMNMHSIVSADGRRWVRAGINYHMTRTVPAGTEFTVGIRLRRWSTSLSSDHLFEFQNAAGTTMFSIYSNGTTGKLEARRGTTVLATSDTVLAIGTYYVEAHIVISDTVGEIALRIDGKSEFAVTGVDTNNTASANCEQIRWNGLFGSGGGGTGVDFNDLYIKGVPGAEGDFYGPILMEPIRPTADVTQEWTRSAGADNFALVDEDSSDSATTYVETSVAATDDLYTMGDLSGAPATVIALVAMTVGSAVDGGSPSVRHVLDDGVSAASVGTERALGATVYRSQAHTFLTAPDAGAWTAAKVNAIRLGIRSA